MSTAKKHFQAEFLQKDIQKEYLYEQFDLVFSSLLLEHVPDDVTVFENLRKMTGHYLLITTIGGNYQKYRKWEDKMGHVRNYSVPELQVKLEKAGFKIKRFITWGFPVYTPLIRQMLNIMPQAGVGKYSIMSKIASKVLYWLCYLNSSRKGDLYIVLAEV